MQEQVYKTLHDSPQANLSDIGEELRKAGNKLGQMITDTNIKRAMLQMREENIRKMISVRDLQGIDDILQDMQRLERQLPKRSLDEFPLRT